jgi:glucose-1-phosphate adenylyltransferase
MPGVVVGAGAHVRRAILDENVHVMPGARIGFGNADSRDFLLTSNGICIVPSNTIVLSQSRRTQGGRHAHPLAQQLSS